MKNKRRRRYKKKKYDLYLISKIALICYLAIFGVGYMSSDTSAYLSSQSEVSEVITASIWEVPEVLNGCGDVSNEDTDSNSEDKAGDSNVETGNDTLPGEEITVDHEDKDINPIEESVKDGISSGEIEIDCEATIDTPKETDKKDVIGEIECVGKNDSLVGENVADSKEEVKPDCENKPNVENGKNKVTKDVKTIEPIIKPNELENVEEKENEDKVNLDDSNLDAQQNSNDESQKESDIKYESVKESKDENSTEKDSTKDETPETNEITDAVK